TEHEFYNYVFTHPDIDVANNKDQIISCLMRTVFKDPYLAFGTVDLSQGVGKLIDAEKTMLKFLSADEQKKAQLKLDFFSKLQPLLPKEAVDTSITRDVFLKVNTHDIRLWNARFYDKSIGDITCDQALEFACETGKELTKMNLTLFTGDPSLELLKKVVASCPHIKIFNLEAKVVREGIRAINDDEVLDLITGLKELEEFSTINRYIPIKIHEKFAELKALRVLKFTACTVGDKALELFADLPTLEILSIRAKTPKGYGGYGGAVTDAGLEHLRRYPALKEVDLTNQVQLTQEALDRLQQEMPNLKITK
ncbi:MAG: hypothetical protein JSR46_12500, partial [Verrucomicrobia bacterium]|nr:hypothetical protein [Verrucomicrobiota bacterium]